MVYLFLIHILIAIYILIDGTRLKLNIIPWVIGAMILGPIILPEYMGSRSLMVRPKFLKNFAIFWAILLIMIGVWGKKAKIKGIRNENLEYRLAVLNASGSLKEDDITIKRFRSLLDQLSQNYMEDRTQIANMSVIAGQKVRENGINVSLLNLMEGLNKLFFSNNLKKPRYAEYVLAYFELRNGGLSHKETVEELQAIVSGY